MRQHNIEMNWRVLPIRSPRVLTGHDDHVITCLQFSGNRIVSGSDDNTLKVTPAHYFFPRPGLPDCRFSSQKIPIWVNILGGLAMEDIGTFSDHFVYFTAVLYI
jgi:hypothetical protein